MREDTREDKGDEIDFHQRESSLLNQSSNVLTKSWLVVVLLCKHNNYTQILMVFDNLKPRIELSRCDFWPSVQHMNKSYCLNEFLDIGV